VIPHNLTSNTVNLGGSRDIFYQWKLDENTITGTDSSTYIVTAELCWDKHSTGYSNQVETDPTGAVYTSGTVNRVSRGGNYAVSTVLVVHLVLHSKTQTSLILSSRGIGTLVKL